MVIDIHTQGNGLRFSSGADTSMDDSTGIPAAAGIQMMLTGQVPSLGVLAPEVLVPADFFAALRRVSAGGGGLMLHRLVDGNPAERLRIRDLLVSPATQAAEAS
jgi:saccharopine dehydrogenase (NAD+, L-lysine-forming)